MRGAPWANERGQMAVELAVLMPVALVVSLVVWNLGRFVAACASFDRVASEAVLAYGTSSAGASDLVVAEDVRSCIVAALGPADSLEVEVSAEPQGVVAGGGGTVSLVCYTCRLAYRPWPRRFVIAGVAYDPPLALVHERVLVVDRFRP